MDYRYINQLLERYWECETSLEEENILRAFFSQKDIPAGLLKYRDLFAYAQEEMSVKALGADFDERILSLVEDEEPLQVKAKKITLTRRLMPLFKAAAVVAMFLTLGNAAQESFENNADEFNVATGGYEKVEKGVSVALKDSAVIDTMKNASLQTLPENIFD